MDEDARGFLRDLVESPSPSGSEEPAVRRWCDRVEGHADAVDWDEYGNAVATLAPGRDTTVVLAGHADEIGFMVNHVTEDGYLYLKPVGGVDAAIAEGRRVAVHGDEGRVPGVTGRKPIHLRTDDERDETPDVEDLYVDVGAADDDAVAEAGIGVGDYVTYDVGLTPLRDGVVAGRGLDDRVGIWAVAEAVRAIDAEELDVTVEAVATVQEELGLRGARMVGYGRDPDAVVAVDVTFATDVPGLDRTEHGAVDLGEGPCLKHGKANHPVLVDRLAAAAQEDDVPVQRAAMITRGATDADAFYTARGGIPTAAIGVPNRNMHTSAELVDTADLAATRDLLATFATSLEPDPSFAPF